MMELIGAAMQINPLRNLFQLWAANWARGTSFHRFSSRSRAFRI
jgi:hypothetical protein